MTDVKPLVPQPAELIHENLWAVCLKLPTDFQPYGKQERTVLVDCSSGCKWFHVLAGTRGRDWGICGNRQSPRAGLLTFEHKAGLCFESAEE